jgi:HAE1 family hydrophobic/amphiphilic exporter-1
LNGILNRPVAILMLHLMIAAFAVFAFMRLPIELTPEVDFPRLSVVTNWGQASSETMVRNITLPIEEAASTLIHVKNVSSTSREGESVVNIDLDKETDLNFTRLELLEKLSAIKKDLPNDVSFPLIQKYVSEDFSSLQGFISYNLFGDMSLSEIKKYAEENIKPGLLGIKGVGAVKVSGASERQIYILLDREKMQSLGITLSDVLEALKNSTNQQTVGHITESKKNILF